MRTRYRNHNIALPPPTTAMVRALRAMVEMDPLPTKCWMSIDDVGYMVKKVFGLPDSADTSATFVNQQLHYDKRIPETAFESFDSSGNLHGHISTQTC